jgi:hypothetical protein
MHLDILLLDFKDKTGARNVYIPGEVATPVAVGNEDEDPKRCQSHVKSKYKSDKIYSPGRADVVVGPVGEGGLLKETAVYVLAEQYPTTAAIAELASAEALVQ